MSGPPTPARVPVGVVDPRHLEPVVGPHRLRELLDSARRVRALLGSRPVVNVSSTATGGGVAELLQMLLGYARGAGVAAEWRVITGSPEFFAVTKRIHNGLYGSPGDGGPLGAAERRIYERAIATNGDRPLGSIRRGDVVVVHDPQPAWLVPLLVDRGARVVWRCHVGIDAANEWSERAWSFLRRYVEPAHAHVFSRASFVPGFLAGAPVAIIPPSIDPLSPKNASMSRPAQRTALAAAMLLRRDGLGRSRRVTRHVHLLREGGALPADGPIVVQVSRWDRMKDMRGVLDGFVEHVPPRLGARLVLAGPAPTGVADDPEAAAVWDEMVERWHSLPTVARRRVQLALIPMDDPDENAYVVNALQRHATVVVQKSLAEGFGLTVAEAMWKSRPVVASAVGGIADQIVDGESGVLLDDPSDLGAFGAAVARLLADPAEARRLGRNARRRVRERFLPDRHLIQYAKLLADLAEAGSG
ncbi:MAG TPA: glycosyltransferase [Gaiellaceae bacterium]